jgi:hypothetical protein
MLKQMLLWFLYEYTEKFEICEIFMTKILTLWVFIEPEVPILYIYFIFHLNTRNIQMWCMIRGATVVFNVTCSL